MAPPEVEEKEPGQGHGTGFAVVVEVVEVGLPTAWGEP